MITEPKSPVIHLKAPDEATLMQALIDAEWTEEVTVEPEVEGGEATTKTVVAAYTHTHSLDIIGTIYKETGAMITVPATDEMPEHQYAEMAPVDGWHANLLLHGEELPASLAPFEIDAPATPYRVFA